MTVERITQRRDTCEFCDKPWATENHAAMQACNCLQTDGADAYTVLVAVADSARRWQGNARIIGNVRADDILRACNKATTLLARHGEPD